MHSDLPMNSNNSLHTLRTAALWIGLAAAAFVLWQVRQALLLGFGAMLTALMLVSLGALISRWCRVSHTVGLVAATVLVAALIVGTFSLFGAQLAERFTDFIDRIQAGESFLTNEFAKSDYARLGARLTQETGSLISSTIADVLSLSLGFVEGAVVWIVASIYLSAQPILYRDGIAALFMKTLRPGVIATLSAIAAALRFWLIGQFLLMLGVGILSFVAFWLIGLPNPGILALVAGLVEFIPYVGPFISAIPAVLIALTVGPHVAMWTIVAYLVIHLFEGYVAAPLTQRYFIRIPPALTLLGIVAAELLFGMIGVILAAPMTVAVFIAVRELYLRNTLGDELRAIGDETNRAA